MEQILQKEIVCEIDIYKILTRALHGKFHYRLKVKFFVSEKTERTK